MNAFGVRGPFRITDADIGPLNDVFSSAFTERYRRDGMVGVRVPTLNPAIWKFSLADAGEGAMLWRDGDGAIAAFNVAHQSGAEGWMGPIAVRTDLQGCGVGRSVVRAGIEWLQESGATVIGLETMPRTVDNIGFYSSLGFVTGPMTITFTVEAQHGDAVERIGRLGAQEQDDAVAACTELTKFISPNHDFSREMRLSSELGVGDTLLLRGPAGRLDGFAICHSAPLVEGRAKEELRVLKVVLRDAACTPAMIRAIAGYARECSTYRAAIRVQGNYENAYRAMVSVGARVRWTDLRMTLAGYGEKYPERGVVLSNWEI